MSVERVVWRGMKRRCYSPKCAKYPRYGGRGIRVCDRWLESFDNFLADMGPRPSPEHSIDRIDNDGNYEPSNCRWATREEQQRNTSRARMITIGGRSAPLAEWEKLSGMGRDAVRARLRRGWSPEEALGRDGRVPRRAERIGGWGRLSAQQVSAIRRRYEAGERQVDLARDFGISQTYVSAIVRRERCTGPAFGA